MAAISRSGMMTVSARKLFERQVVLMIGKRLCTVRYVGGQESGVRGKTREGADVCAQN